jgi:diguanylate cyclase (GGDEF)-like protein
VLRDVGSALVSLTKAHDLAARYGGDEFVVLLPGCPRTEVVSVAERVREAIANKVSVEGVTASAGVATIPDDATDSAELVATADAALYAAKHAGRDQVGTPP